MPEIDSHIVPYFVLARVRRTLVFVLIVLQGIVEVIMCIVMFTELHVGQTFVEVVRPACLLPNSSKKVLLCLYVLC